MKRLGILLMFTAIVCGFGCSSGKDEPFFPEEREHTFSVKPQTFFYLFKPSDVKGFERHPLIEDVRHWDSGSIVVDENITFQIIPRIGEELSNIIFRYKSEEDVPKVHKLNTAINDQGITVGYAGEDSQYQYLAGIKNNKMWIGAFDSDTREQVHEWQDDKIVERQFRKHLGYGEYRDYTISYLFGDICKVNDNITIACIHLYDKMKDPYSHYLSTLYGFFLLTDEVIRLELPDEYEKFSEVRAWFGDSFLLQCYNDWLLVTPEKDLYKMSDAFDPDLRFPISYTEYFSLSNTRFSLYDMKEERNIWFFTPEPLEGLYESEMRSKLVFENEVDGIYEFRVDIAYKSGGKKSVTFRVDREGNFY